LVKLVFSIVYCSIFYREELRRGSFDFGHAVDNVADLVQSISHGLFRQVGLQLTYLVVASVTEFDGTRQLYSLVRIAMPRMNAVASLSPGSASSAIRFVAVVGISISGMGVVWDNIRIRQLCHGTNLRFVRAASDRRGFAITSAFSHLV
jgi:hypothetical protein